MTNEAPQPTASETALLSEAALAEDWNRPEEEAAWRHLQMAQTLIPWDAPLVASWARATELESLLFDRRSLTLQLKEEDTEQIWTLVFSQLQAFRMTTEECAFCLDYDLTGGFFEVKQSAWIQQLGAGEIPFLEKSRHFVISCYDEVVEVIAWNYTWNQLTVSTVEGQTQ